MQKAEWLMDLLLSRRSRRFCLGMNVPGGALAYQSRFKPAPLTPGEEARLVFAAAGITGTVLADFDFSKGAGANIMSGLVGRTIPSGDAIQTVALAVVNDSGSYFLKRPENLSPAQLKRSFELAKSKEFESFYQENRVQLSEGRAMPACEPLFNINVNRWSFGAPGTSYFLPINDLTYIYINGLLEILNEETGAYILDDRAGFRAAGLKRFAASRGGHLIDDPTRERVATVSLVERMVTEFVALEQGLMVQNLALVTEALGLGGFPNFANHDLAWFKALGFVHNAMRTSTYLGASRLAATALRLTGKDALLDFPVGLERGGDTLMRSYAPPYFPNMRKAVEAVATTKERRLDFALSGPGPFRNEPPKFQKVSAKAVDAAIAYCEYIWKQHGRFPAQIPRFKTIVGFQAGHPDLEFYDRFYTADSISETHREIFRQQAAPR